MKRLSLVNLETLCWIHRLGTFNAAAQRMNTTQPAVSARVRELEVAVGVPLFGRKGRRMELTIEGRALVARIEPLIYQIEDVVVSLDNPDSAVGVVRMAIGEMVALSWAPQLVKELKRRLPRVIFEIEVDFSLRARERLLTGKVDVGIVPGPFAEHGLRCQKVGSVRLGWYVAAELAAQRGLSQMTAPEVLEALPIFSLSRTSNTHQIVCDTLKEWGARSNNINTCSQLSMLTGVVCSGAGLGLLPEIIVAPQIERGELVRASRYLVGRSVDFFIGWHENQSQSLVRNIVDLALECSSFEKGRATS